MSTNRERDTLSVLSRDEDVRGHDVVRRKSKRHFRSFANVGINVYNDGNGDADDGDIMAEFVNGSLTNVTIHARM